MRTYNEYLTEVQHSEPFVKVSIAGIDLTDRLVRDMGIETDALLDTPELSVFTASEVVVYLTNHDNYFSAKKRPNFFTENDLDASGWRVPLLIQGGFIGLPARVFFYGEIEEVRQVPGKRFVRILVLDLSTRLRHALVDNFGEPVTRNLSGTADAPSYSEVNPVYQLGVGDLPVSRDSLTARIGNEHLTVHPSLPVGGASGDYRDIAVNLNTGILTFGGEPPDKNRTTLNLSFKTAYRYRTPEFLVYELAKAQGIYAGMNADEQRFARTLLQSPTLKHARNVVSARGRPKSLTDKPVIRGITSDDNGVYLCGDRSILHYQRRSTEALDSYTLFGACPDTDAVLLEIIKDGSDFYLLSAGSFSGHLTSKIWKYDGNTWTELAGPTNGHPTPAYPYDYVTSRDPVADNRKSFIRDGNWLYFVYGNNETSGGLNIQRNGVRRVNVDTGQIQTLFSQGTPADYGIDFTIHNNRLYVFVCQRGSGTNNYLRVFWMNRDGNNPTEIHTEQFDRGDGFYPATVSDIAVLDDHFYFVFAKHRTRIVSGTAELSRLPVDGGTRDILKRYDNMLFGPRGLTVYKDRVYFVEGQWMVSFSNKTYPTFSDAGHLQSIDTHGMIVDHGGAWRSHYDKTGGTGLGMHTAFSSNLWHDTRTDSLFFIAGYGLPIDVDADSIATVNRPIAQDLTNWVWLQYGQNLSMRIAEFRTNGVSVWELMSRLAKTTDWEIGFTEAVDELKAFYTANPSVQAFEPKRYLFFRPRSVSQSDLVLDGSVNVQVSAALDTTLVFNHIVVAYGDGYWTEKDDALIAETGSLSFEINTGLLSAQDEPWAEILGRRYLERQRVPRQKVSSLLKFAPQLELGQYLEITSKWNAFDEVPFQITQIEHFSDEWQTRIEGREIVVALEPLQFEDPIEDVMFQVGDSVSEVLSEATGGLSPLMYTLTGLPTGLSFTEATRSYNGTVTAVGVSLVTYTVADASDPALTLSATFKLIVKAVATDPDPEPEPGEPTVTDRRVWSAMSIVSVGRRSQVFLVDNRNNTGHIYNHPNQKLASTVDLGSGDWVDGSGFGLRHYVLDNNANALRAYSAAADLSSVSRQASADIMLSSGEWVAVAIDATYVYVLNKTDWTVYVYEWSTGTAQSSRNIELDLIGEYTSMAVRNGKLHVLVGNAGITIDYDISSRDRVDSNTEFIQGTVDWIGLDASGATDREGLYAVRSEGSRVLAYTPSRESGNDFYNVF